MKLGSIWYCITKACSQPAYGCGWCSPNALQRVSASHNVHHSMASSTLLDPMKNISRCGARASSAGEDLVAAISTSAATAALRRQLHEVIGRPADTGGVQCRDDFLMRRAGRQPKRATALVEVDERRGVNKSRRGALDGGKVQRF